MYFSVNVHCSSRVQLYRHCPIHLFFLKTFIHNFHWFLKYTYLPYNTKFLHPYVFCHGCRLVDWNKTRGQYPQRKGGMIYTEQNEIKLLWASQVLVFCALEFKRAFIQSRLSAALTLAEGRHD